MKSFFLNFTFKGDRNYIQGPDIYTRLLEYLYTQNFKISNIDISFHKIARNNLKGELFSVHDTIPNTANAVCILKFMHANAESYVVHLSETDTAITESHPYFEEKIVSASDINTVDKSILLASSTPYNTIEKVVALNKALLLKLLTGPGKWYFTRLTIDQDINNQNPEVISLKLVKNIGSKITKTLIRFDNNIQGYVYFSKSIEI